MIVLPAARIAVHSDGSISLIRDDVISFTQLDRTEKQSQITPLQRKA